MASRILHKTLAVIKLLAIRASDVFTGDFKALVEDRESDVVEEVLIGD